VTHPTPPANWNWQRGSNFSRKSGGFPVLGIHLAEGVSNDLVALRPTHAHTHTQGGGQGRARVSRPTTRPSNSLADRAPVRFSLIPREEKFFDSVTWVAGGTGSLA
jgi:hypothetical protein